METYRFLLVEDMAVDAEMAVRTLRKNNISFEFKRVETEIDFVRELAEFKPHLVISDYSMPQFTGMKALERSKELQPDLPFIVLTGSINEETAVTCMKAGATDYILKDNLTRLPYAVLEALKHAETEKQKRLIEGELHESEERYKAIFKHSHAIMLLIDPEDGSIADVNPAACKFYGYSREELLSLKMSDINKLDEGELKNIYIKVVKGEQSLFLMRHHTATGIKRYVDVYSGPIHIKQKVFLFSIIHDVSKRVLAEKALKESEEKYRLMFDKNPQPMLIYKIDTLEFLEVNKAAVAHYGYTREEFLSMTIKDIRPQEDVERLLNALRTENRKFSESQQWRHKKKNGELIDVEVTSHELIFNGVEARHVLINDITERKKAEATNRLLSKALEQSPVSVVVTDANGVIQYINQKFTQITGYTPEEAIGLTPRISKSGVQGDTFYKKLWETITNKLDWEGELVNKRKNGKLYWESVLISPLLDQHQNITNYIGIKEDITAQKQMLNELIEAKEKAEESDRLKTAFLHNISHEIRTPMNAIMGFSALLNDPELDADKRRFFIDVLKQNSTQLLNIISDIINIATIEAGQIKVQEQTMNLNATMSLLYEQFATKAKQLNLEFTFTNGLSDSEAFITADETKLAEIFSNLIQNALKFTKQGSVNYGYSIRNNQIEAYVEDTGIGIPANKQKEIFERFRQVENNMARNYGGSGLGLSIAKAYVEIMGGELKLHSEVEKGSTFYFNIPYKAVASPGKTANQSESAGSIDINETKTILIAEDDDNNFMLLDVLLLSENLNIIRARNGLEALEKLKSNPAIDLILMDTKMPEMSGLEATRAIREFNTSIPIITQTAFAMPGDRERALEAGSNDYLTKPFSRAALFELIEKYTR
ncbi:MAG: PAS domain S-box protein [Salinivirgaceae bacterium]